MQLHSQPITTEETAKLPKATGLLARSTSLVMLIASLASCEMNPSVTKNPDSKNNEPEETKSCCSKSKTCEAPKELSYEDLTASDAKIKITKSANPPAMTDMVLIPAKTVMLGGGREDTAPLREVSVPAFLISKTETTNKDFAKFITETGYVTVAERPWEGNPAASLVFVAPQEYNAKRGSSQWWKLVKGANWKQPEGPGSNLVGREDLPVVHVTLEDALAYAKWAGREIPTEAQFRSAGTLTNSEMANNSKPDPKEVNYYQGHFPLKDLAEDGHAGLAKVGSYKPNVNGLYDLAGNAWELTKTYYSSDKAFVVIAGGSFLCSWEGDFTCTNASPFGRTSQDVISSSNHVTFRTVSAKE